MRGQMDCYGLTDIGKVREANEDQFLIADLIKSMLVHHTSLSHENRTRLFGGSQGPLLVVADGMGGHAAGEQASAIAVETLERYVLNTMPWFFRLQESQENDLKEELKAALEACQRSIELASAGSPARRHMGTTLTMAYIIWPRLYVVHAGDSRCYLYRKGKLEQITTDHNMAQQLVERGTLTSEEAQGSRWSHVLWNCLGGGSHELNPEVYKAGLALGDTVLLCTDGLTKLLQDEAIVNLLRQEHGAEETCRRLVSAANEAGGRDNVTVIVARFCDAHNEGQAQEHVALEETVEEGDAIMASA
jgi:PPM family protein phosphatase